MKLPQPVPLHPVNSKSRALSGVVSSTIRSRWVWVVKVQWTSSPAVRVIVARRSATLTVSPVSQVSVLRGQFATAAWVTV